MAKVLFVDDEPDIELLARQKFRKQVADGDFELLFALNGEEALDVIKTTPDLAVIVTDINMPQMDGLALLEKVKEANPAVKTIILSAYGDTHTLRSAMNKGAYDFVTKPINFTELGTLIEATLKHSKDDISPLYTYQLILADSLPARVDLNIPHQRTPVLWDAFDLDKDHILAFGLSLLPSCLPIDLAITATHGLLKASLQETPHLSIADFEKKLARISPELKAHLIIGQYHKGTHAFSFRVKGEFKALHIIEKDKKELESSETALLNLGNGISLKHLPSGSILSLSCIEKA